MLIKNKRRKILTILIIILFVIGIFLLNKNHFNKNNLPNNSYQLENKTNYEVTLKPNNYFSNSKIPADNYYIGDAIKSIDIYFNYYLKTNIKEHINYSYDITASLKSYADNGTKLIWTKDFNLDNKEINQKELIIKEVYNLDYQYYVNYVRAFQEYYNIKTETYLDIKLSININHYNPYVLLTIPINTNIVEITMKEDKELVNTNNQNNDYNWKIFIILIIAIIIFVIKNKFYNNNENKLLKKNQDIIINTKNKPFLNSNEIIYLTNLKDLIDIAIDYNMNIFCYHNYYYFIKDNTYYIYILREK